MKNSLIPSLIFLFGFTIPIFSQSDSLKSSKSSLTPSALVDFFSTEKGMLLPRMTIHQRDNIAQPTTGMIVFNSTTMCFDYYVENLGWKSLCGEMKNEACSDNAHCSDDFYCAKMPGNCDGAGICTLKPVVCLDVYDPVCGCDGNTYTNACEAAASGVNVDYEGPCPNICNSNDECNDDEYCHKEPGDCEGEGQCVKRSVACPDIWDPVCGCDGNTYGNACEAAAAGVNIDYEGACNNPTGCSGNDDCASTHYCKKALGDCDGVGVCTPKPDLCPAIFDPVCGCDGKTYTNECMAALEGINVAHKGLCEPASCDIFPCQPGYYCKKETGDCDGEGTCAEKPVVCPQIFSPVCGCDGNTYTNACFAAAAGVNIAFQGPCNTSCSDDGDCPEGYYCKKDKGDCDGNGICTPIPDVCINLYDPVCGCDGNTYSNSCYAAAAGMSVDHDGPCVNSCTGNDDCPPDYYCKKTIGDCNGEGVCTVKPTLCPEIFDPVCGCDGNTYPNPCFAAQAGANIDYEGNCTTSCSNNADCPEGYYCKKEPGKCDEQGICTLKPVACPDVYDPVCGCDGVTYGNPCEAAAAGVNINFEGPCPASCSINGQCPPGYYCDSPNGDCGQSGNGICKPIPQNCPNIFDPVCGCDGNTYTNACEAAKARVSIASDGQCPSNCNVLAGICPPDYYCKRQIGECESGTGDGVCTPKPLACPDVFDPVCGCDNQTYDNECEAALAGKNIAYLGPCGVGQSCQENGDCPPGFYCNTPIGDCNGVSECRPIPMTCPAIFDPVCGCDGNTYSNACYAAQEGVSVAQEGPCPTECAENGNCVGNYYCKKENGDCDGSGTCTLKPVACPDVYDPVCGCDGITYDNDCEAAMAGTNVSFTGQCAAGQPCGPGLGDCPPGYFCNTQVGDCGGFSTCTLRPTSCLGISDPVCGCDGITYLNECQAAMAGISIDYLGQCSEN